MDYGTQQVAHTNSAAPQQRETAQLIIETIRKQAEQLRSETRDFADVVTGPQPEKLEACQGMGAPIPGNQSLLASLQEIRRVLGDACNYIRRGRDASGF